MANGLLILVQNPPSCPKRLYTRIIIIRPFTKPDLNVFPTSRNPAKFDGAPYLPCRCQLSSGRLLACNTLPFLTLLPPTAEIIVLFRFLVFHPSSFSYMTASRPNASASCSLPDICAYVAATCACLNLFSTTARRLNYPFHLCTDGPLEHSPSPLSPCTIAKALS